MCTWTFVGAKVGVRCVVIVRVECSLVVVVVGVRHGGRRYRRVETIADTCR